MKTTEDSPLVLNQTGNNPPNLFSRREMKQIKNQQTKKKKKNLLETSPETFSIETHNQFTLINKTQQRERSAEKLTEQANGRVHKRNANSIKTSTNTCFLYVYTEGGESNREEIEEKILKDP